MENSIGPIHQNFSGRGEPAHQERWWKEILLYEIIPAILSKVIAMPSLRIFLTQGSSRSPALESLYCHRPQEAETIAECTIMSWLCRGKCGQRAHTARVFLLFPMKHTALGNSLIIFSNNRVSSKC